MTYVRQWIREANQYRTLVLTLSSVALFATMFARLVISPVASEIVETFQITTGTFGFAATAMWVTYACSQFPSGILGDRFGERKVILFAVGLTGVSALLLALSPTYAVFLAFMAMLGLGTGMQYPAGTTLLTKLFSDTGRAIGIHITAGSIAGMVAPVVASAMAVRYGWRAAILSGVAIALPGFVLFQRYVRPTAPEHPSIRVRNHLDPSILWELVSRRAIAFTTFIAVLADFVWQATFTFLPLFLQEFHGFDTEYAGFLFGAYFLVQTAAQPVAGWLSDRAGRDLTTILLAGCGVVGYGALIVGDQQALVLAGVALTSIAMSWSAPVQSRFMDHLSDEERGTGFGLVRTLYTLLGALGSVVTGTVAAWFGWTAAIGLLGFLLTVVVVALAGHWIAGVTRRLLAA